ncbi:T9SS type A sorting domain-containing protein [Flavihumibacter sp. UBA7668]|uniref:T9SS type A sorting domain-containing protein n=1 Tax=Flavihumibacter sp. UBA7668 TaxID=1946542 RepID=UPI0025BDAD27|nr:T9SS type A sorting domain-containing protein [Flavihumibacter sp. UBA7668]
MRSILQLLTLLFCAQLVFAQADFSSALPLKADEQVSGTVSAANRNVYYKTLLPADGTITIYINGTHAGGSAGNFDLYVYDKSRRQIAVKRTLGNRSFTAGQEFSDTISVYSRAIDSIYILAYQNSSQTFNFQLSYSMDDTYPTDPEPNGEFKQATPIASKQSLKGLIGYVANGTTDRYDYYKTLLPVSGTVKVYVEGKHTGGSAGSFDLYAYDKAGRNIQMKRTIGKDNHALGESFKDTMLIYSRSADSIYLLAYQNSSQSFSYSISYEVVDQSIEDVEPNNEFEQALPLAQEETKYGRIGNVTNGTTDRYDYYKTLLPYSGTVAVYVQGVHTGGSAGSFDLYVYDKGRRQIAFKRTLGNKSHALGETFTDTLLIPSRDADSLYITLYQNSSQSFDYTVKYAMINQSAEDPEPNNTRTEAVPAAYNEMVYGRIGNVANGVTDRYDYYQAILPADGTLTFYINGTHTGGSTGSFDFYVLDKAGREIGSKRTIGNKNHTLNQQFSDTVKVYSRAADTLYYYVYQNSSQSFDYGIRYTVEDQSTNDAELNDDYATAVFIPVREIKEGHIGYVTNGAIDRYDYYKAVLPADGTLTIYISGKHTGGTAGNFDLYVYDKGKRQLSQKRSIGNKSLSLYEEFRDTLKVYSRAADTLYFYPYQNSSQSFSYQISFDVLDQSENDQEPNGDFPIAKPIDHNETRSGHIGYVANGVTDRYDYFKTLLPVDGTVTIYVEGVQTGGTAGSIDFYAFDRSRRQILVKRSLGNKEITYGQTFRDTIELPSRAADSLYLLLYHNSSQSFSYKIRYVMPDALQGDPEPNNSFGEAAVFNNRDTIIGLLGYVSNALTDRNDYFKMAVPEKSTVTVYIEAEHTGGSNGSFAFYAYDKNRRQLAAKSVVGSAIAAGATLRDTIVVNCNSTDSLYLLMYQNSSRSFTYKIRMEIQDNKPEAAFSYTRTGNEFGFINKSQNANTVLWRFGNNLTSTVNYPLQELRPGFYTIQLIATNSVCNFRDTVRQEITVSGVESFTPTEAGVGGDLIMTIYGGGLAPNTSVTLSGSGGTLTPKETINDAKGQQLGAVFDLHFAQPGVYDLTVGFPNQSPIVYEKAFTINNMVYPETWSEVTGPSIWRTGREANFNLVIGNRGNTMARGGIVAIAWPKDVKVEWLGKEHRPDPNQFTEITMDDGEVIRTKNDVVQWIYDVNTTRPIDTFGVEPFDGYVKYFTIPMVPAGSTVEIPFRASSTASGMHKFKTYTVKPNQFGSCETFNIGNALTGPAAVELYINTLDILVDEAKVPPATKIPAQVAVKSLKVTQKHIDVSSNVLFHRMWAKWYGADDLTDDEYYDYYKEGLAADEFAIKEMKDLAFDQTINLGVGGLATKRAEKLTGQLDAANKSMLNHADKSREYMSRSRKVKNPGRKEALEALSAQEAELFKDALASGDFTIDELRKFEKWTDALQTAKDYKTAAGQLEKLIAYIEENCPEHKEQLEKLKEMLNKEKDIQEEKEKETETRTSYDPNAIYGPGGYKAARYVNNKDRQPFVVLFENVDTAKADAQIVQILDTLDKTKFDLSSFEFGNITIGKKAFRVPKGRKQFMMERSLAPYRNMRVRVNASMDTTTGIVSWQFTSIDPVTGDLPDFDGFLPPNKDYPSGEGSVSYSVNPVANLANGTEMVSRASIIFDTNEPILTNTWKNTIDALQPTGQIRAQVLEDSMMLLTYTATDAGSGVNYFHLYMSEDGGEWVPIQGGQGDSIILFGDPGKTYRFFMEAMDNTGNRENKITVGEAFVRLPEEPGIQPAGNWSVYPIPTNGTINLELDIPEAQQLVIQVYSAGGQRVAELYNGSVASGALRLNKTVQNLSSGLYFIQVRGSKGLDLKKKILVAK